VTSSIESVWTIGPELVEVALEEDEVEDVAEIDEEEDVCD
jgi:hypothetical protein